MTEQDALFDWKHARLWRISFASDFLASVAIVVFVFLALAEIYSGNQQAQRQYQTSLIGLFSQEPIFILDVLLRIIRLLLEGAVYCLVLRGIALGLNMIVETDINYREKHEEDTE
jgi:hypothetical protein